MLWTHEVTESTTVHGKTKIRVWQRHYNVWHLDMRKGRNSLLEVTQSTRRDDLIFVAEKLVEMLTDPA